MARRAEEQGVHMLDAPVSGGDVGAREGTLSIMVGGDGEVLDKVRPVLEAMGKNIVHCGPIGAGQTVKACNQILAGINLLAMVEALAFAKKSGVDLEKMLQVTTRERAHPGPWRTTRRACSRGIWIPAFRSDFNRRICGSC